MLMAMNASYSRTRLARQLGGGYDGEADPRRNIAAECGWPTSESITPESLGEMYDRLGVAARVVDLMPEEAWQVTPFVYEDEDVSVVTAFEQAVDDLCKSLRGTSWYEGDEGNPLWEHLLRMDRLCGVGSYGALLLGLDDGKELLEPADGLDERGDIRGAPSGRKLLFLREFDERLASVNAWETERTNPRYGQPISYNLTFDDPKLTGGTKGSGRATEVAHWTRVIHVADNLGTSDLFGVPRMRPVFNDLLDLRKLYGGSAEMYWQGAFPGMGFKTDPQLGADVQFPSDFKETMENYMNGLQRWMAVGGVDPKMLSPTVVSPTDQIQGHLEAICIRLGVPMRIFLGSERGELSSSQDSRAWTDRLRRRQNTWITPRLVAPVIDRLICLGALPQPSRYVVEWPDIAQKTDQEKLDAALKKTQAVAAYIQGNLESVVTPMAYFTNFLDFTDEEATAILEEAEVNIAEKIALDLPPIGQELAPPPAPNPFGGGGMPGGEQQMVGEDGQPLPPEEQIDAEAEAKKQELEEKGPVPPQFQQNTFCPTGEGGGVDPGCSPDEAGSVSKSPLKEVQQFHQVTKGAIGQGAFVLPDGRLIDVGSETEGGGDHFGVFTALDNAKQFGIKPALAKRLAKGYEKAVDGDEKSQDDLRNAWSQLYAHGVIRVRQSGKDEVGLDMDLTKKFPSHVVALVKAGKLPKVSHYTIENPLEGYMGTPTIEATLSEIAAAYTWDDLRKSESKSSLGRFTGNEEQPLPGVPEALLANAFPDFLKKKEEEGPEPEDELLDLGGPLEPELDPLTGEPEVDPVTGEPIEQEIDPVTGLPVEQKTGYDALIEEAKGVLEVRGGLLPSDHVPSLRERLLHEEAGMATFDDDEEEGGEPLLGDKEDSPLDEEKGNGEPFPEEENDETSEETPDDEEEIKNAFCPTGEGGGVDPSCGSPEHGAAVTESEVAKSGAFQGDAKTMAIMAARTIEAGTGKGITVKEGGKTVGILSYKKQGKDVYVRYLASGKKGVGRRLVAEAAVVAAREGKNLVLEGFSKARGFYEKLGMEPLGDPNAPANKNIGYIVKKKDAAAFAARHGAKG